MDDDAAARRVPAPWTSHPSFLERPGWTTRRRLASWVWALAPALTFGLVNGATFLYAAIRQRGWGWWLAFGGYAGMTVSIFALSNAPDDSPADNAQSALIMTNWILGAGHALGTRRRVFQTDATVDLAGDPVLAAALHAQERRDLARQILGHDPRLASDLAIGRPDLGRGYDDGGLVDVNTAPATLLTRLPGLTEPLAQRVVVARAAAGGFTSLEEMAILADLPPGLIDLMRDRVVLSPR